MKKRLLAILLTALMVVGMVPLQAAAADPQDQTALPSDGGELASGSYYLAADTQLTADLVIPEDADVTLELNGHTLTGSGSGSVITVAEGASLSITDSSTAGTGVITGGKSSSGGAIANQGTLSMTGGTVSGNEATSAGGAIYTTGDMTLQNVTIRDNKTTGDNSTGGGISISEESGSALKIAITSCVVEGNTSHMKGGGLDYLSQNNTSTSEITIAGTVFRANEASGTDLPDGTKAAGVGGGASLMGVVTLSDCQFFENTARSGGGLSISGLSDSEGDITIENCVFQENAAATESQPTEIPDTEGETVPTTGMGGGIYSQMGNFTIKGGSVTNNTAALGGGVCAAVAGVTLADGGVICNNTAEEGGDDFCFLYTFGVYTSKHSLTLPSPAIFGIDGVQQWFEDAPDKRYKEDMTGVDKYDGFTNETADHYLSAGQVFTVTFDSNGGSYVAPVFAAPNKTIDQPQDPTYTGYIFQGWQTQAGDSFDFETAITEDMTLVAQWETDPAYALFTLTYANTDIPPEEVLNGTTVDLTDRTPTKEGFDFAGWYADAEWTQPITSVYMDGPKTVYAKWTEKVEPGITIHFETYGGTPVEDIFMAWEDFQEAFDHDEDAFEAFLSDLPTVENPKKEGYEFLWWTWDYAGDILRLTQNSPDEELRATYEEAKAEFDETMAGFEANAEALWNDYQSGSLNEKVQEILDNFDYENSAFFKDEETIIKLWMENIRNYYTECIACGTNQNTLVPLTMDTIYEINKSKQGDLYVLMLNTMPLPAETWAFFPFSFYFKGHDVTVTVHAKYWNPETGEIATPYTLTYDANGGQNAPASVKLVPGAATLSEQAPTREGYTFAGWNTQQDGSGTTYQAGGAFTMPKEDVTLYAQWAAGTVTLTPQDMTAYTGGDSISGDNFPSVRYAITGVESTAIPDLEFTVGGNTCKPKQAGSYWLLSDVENTFTLAVSQKTRAAGEYENDGLAGEYTIGVENDDTLTVKGADDKQYAVKVADGEDAGILTVRNVSDPNAVLEDKMDIAQEVVSSESQVDTSKGAVAVIENGATYYTNGKKANLGVLGASSATPTSGEQIALLFDNILERDAVAGADTITMMMEHAQDKGYTLTDGQYEFKYLDLINENDGNAWVSTNKPITIFWPYPSEELAANRANYKFTVLHFEGLHRQYQITTENDMQALIGQSTVVPITAEATDKGVKFTLPANEELGSFSPFALSWSKNNTGSSSSGGSGGGATYYTLRYESNGGTEYDSERYRRNTVVKLDKVPSREGYTFTGWYADKETTERVTEIKLTGNKTVYAGWEATEVPDWLNGDDHFAYVIGYEDGTVRPMANISRAEVATIFFRLLKPEIRDAHLTASSRFTDVSENAWYCTAVSTMAELGVLKGRTDTAFEPDAPITRAEFAAICARFDTNQRDGDSNFTDIGSHWAKAEIERACILGWINGYEDSTFRPDNQITRAEAMTMINRVLNRLPETAADLLSGMQVWPDNQPEDWFYLAVQEATNSHDFDRKGDIHEHWTTLTGHPNWEQYQ